MTHALVIISTFLQKRDIREKERAIKATPLDKALFHILETEKSKSRN